MTILLKSHLFAAQMEGGDDLNYAALPLTGRKATSGRKKKEPKTEESVYSQLRCWMYVITCELVHSTVLNNSVK